MDYSVFGEVASWIGNGEVDDLEISIDRISGEGAGKCDGGEVAAVVQVGEVLFVPVFGIFGQEVESGVQDDWMWIQLSSFRGRRESSMKWGECRMVERAFRVVFVESRADVLFGRYI